MSFALFDIDHFKRINDEHGHIMGDTVIMEVTRALQQDIRTSDVVARYGGDELILLLPHTNCAGTLQLAERMRRKIELLEFGDGNHRIQVTVSCGISSYPESQAKTLEDMLRAADDALYRAKAAGRNRVEAHRADHGDTETQRA
jgi:diguanylate cyclase (GGDEF)-like protein